MSPVRPLGPGGSGGGAVDSVNGQIGVVVLDAADVGAPTSHDALTGLNDDDHTHYHNDTRGDSRYYEKLVADGLFAAITHDHDLDYSDIAHDHDLDYSDISHTHSSIDSPFTSGGLTHKSFSGSVDSAASITFPASVTGFGTIQYGTSGYCRFMFSSGAATPFEWTSDFAFTDTALKMSLYTDTGVLTLKNNLASGSIVRYSIEYSATS